MIQRRSLLKIGLASAAVPWLDGWSAPLARAFADEGQAMAAADLLHNLRYGDLPVTASRLRSEDHFALDAERLRTHVEGVLNDGRFAHFRVRCGGHSYFGASAARSAYVLNLAPYRKLAFDPARQTLRVAAGCLLGDVTNYLAQLSPQAFLPTGDCPSVGFSGFTIGGGISQLSPLLGLGVDSAVEATIIVFKRQHGRYHGEILTVSPFAHADLYWAIMGGGGQFGLISDLTVRPTFIAGGRRYTISAQDDQRGFFARLFSSWQALGRERLHPSTSSKFQIDHHGSMSIVGVVTNQELDLRTLQDFAHDHAAAFEQRPLVQEAVNFAAVAPVPAEYQAAKSTMLSTDWTLASDQLDQLAAKVQERREDESAYMQVMRWCGAMQREQPQVSFPWRHCGYECQVIATTRRRELWSQTGRFDGWVDAVVNLLGERQGAYFNHGHGEVAEHQRLYFGDAWPALLAVKKTYDPDGVFDALKAADQA